jgi:hypothetical protein
MRPIAAQISPLTPASRSDVVLALSLNKTDLPADQQLVTRAQAQQAAAAIGCSMYCRRAQKQSRFLF